MIKVSGQIGFFLDFEIEVNMTEEEWDSLTQYEQMERVTSEMDISDYRNLEPDGIDVWDLEEVKEEESA